MEGGGGGGDVVYLHRSRLQAITMFLSNLFKKYYSLLMCHI